MSVQVKRFERAGEAMRYLEDLVHDTQDTVVFRGHVDARFRLVNSWQRHCSKLRESWDADIQEALTAYRAGLEKLGINSLEDASKFEAMELGRHHGVPVPCLDFSYSPYVALFFAFNGLTACGDLDGWSVIFVLNVNRLAEAWAAGCHDPAGDSEAFDRAVAEFLWPPRAIFDAGFPADLLQFIPFPGRCNKRMQRQLGCLLFDTLRYGRRGLRDLEDYIAGISRDSPEAPILIRVLIRHRAVSEVFTRLELMNITGGNLYDSAEGVAMDITNAYHYSPKFSYLRDIAMPAKPGGAGAGGKMRSG